MTHTRDGTGRSGSVVHVGPFCMHKQIDLNVNMCMITELNCHVQCS